MVVVRVYGGGQSGRVGVQGGEQRAEGWLGFRGESRGQRGGWGLKERAEVVVGAWGGLHWGLRARGCRMLGKVGGGAAQ